MGRILKFRLICFHFCTISRKRSRGPDNCIWMLCSNGGQLRFVGLICPIWLVRTVAENYAIAVPRSWSRAALSVPFLEPASWLIVRRTDTFLPSLMDLDIWFESSSWVRAVESWSNNSVSSQLFPIWATSSCLTSLPSPFASETRYLALTTEEERAACRFGIVDCETSVERTEGWSIM